MVFTLAEVDGWWRRMSKKANKSSSTSLSLYDVFIVFVIVSQFSSSSLRSTGYLKIPCTCVKTYQSFYAQWWHENEITNIHGVQSFFVLFCFFFCLHLFWLTRSLPWLAGNGSPKLKERTESSIAKTNTDIARIGQQRKEGEVGWGGRRLVWEKVGDWSGKGGDKLDGHWKMGMTDKVWYWQVIKVVRITSQRQGKE